MALVIDNVPETVTMFHTGIQIGTYLKIMEGAFEGRIVMVSDVDKYPLIDLTDGTMWGKMDACDLKVKILIPGTTITITI